MIASILRLSRFDYKALKITDVYSIHRVVYSLFPAIPDESRDFLFVDKGGDFYERRILILSKRSPLTPEHGRIESKNISPAFLERDAYCFEVRLNPTKRDKQTGRIIPAQGLIKEEKDNETKREKLAQWFCAKSETWGFRADPERLELRTTGVQVFDKQEMEVTQNAATFAGVLRVTDRELFIRSFEQGIGRGKSFGFGLLELVPTKE
jgi:CRISPR system Cascade subunit CasE